MGRPPDLPQALYGLSRIRERQLNRLPQFERRDSDASSCKFVNIAVGIDGIRVATLLNRAMRRRRSSN